MYNPTINLEHVSGNNYNLATSVEIPNGTSLSLESNSVSGTMRTVVYRVVGDHEAGSYTANEDLAFTRTEDETEGEVVIKEGGKVKGKGAYSFD